MNYIDIILLAFLLWGAVRGFIKGFIIELTSLLAFVLGIYGAVKFSGYVAGWLGRQFDMTGQYVPVAAFVITFILITIAINLAGKLFDKLAKAVSLGILNRILGVLFGLFKAAFLLSVIILVLNTIDNHVRILPQEKVGQSKIYKPLAVVAPAVLPVLKNSFFRLYATEEPKPESPQP
jgi:membrane protein required for colicin V production